MSNTFSPFGFRPFGQQEGTAPTGGMSRYFIASSDTNSYYTGDVVLLSSAQAFGTNPNTISPLVASSGYVIAGVFVGCEYYNGSVGRTVWNSYFPASVGSSSPCNAYVIDNPQQLFIAQVSTTTATLIGSSNIGWGIAIASSVAGNTTTGQSGQCLASSVAPTIQSATSPFRVVDVYANFAPPGVNGTSSGSEGANILVVRPNLWARNSLNAAST